MLDVSNIQLSKNQSLKMRIYKLQMKELVPVISGKMNSMLVDVKS